MEGEEIDTTTKIKPLVCDYEKEVCYIEGLGPGEEHNPVNQSGGGLSTYGDTNNFLVPISKSTKSRRKSTPTKRKVKKTVKRSKTKQKKVSKSRHLVQIGGRKRKRNTQSKTNNKPQVGFGKRKKQKRSTTKDRK